MQNLVEQYSWEPQRLTLALVLGPYGEPRVLELEHAQVRGILDIFDDEMPSLTQIAELPNGRRLMALFNGGSVEPICAILHGEPLRGTVLVIGLNDRNAAVSLQPDEIAQAAQHLGIKAPTSHLHLSEEALLCLFEYARRYGDDWRRCLTNEAFGTADPHLLREVRELGRDWLEQVKL